MACTSAAVGTIPAPGTSLTKSIAILGSAGYYLQGYVTELRVWSSARGAFDIKTNYRRRLYNQLWSTTLVWVWRFDEGYGSTLYEYSTHDGKNMYSSTALEWNPDPAPTPVTICENDCYHDGVTCRCNRDIFHRFR